jgi:hypothetical protein
MGIGEDAVVDPTLRRQRMLVDHALKNEAACFPTTGRYALGR